MLSNPVVALVPVRSPGVGKSRLAVAGFDTTQRARLSAAMLADVTRALQGSAVDSIVVVAGGPEAAAAAAALGLDVLVDPPGVESLNAAVAAAQLALRDVGSLLVVMADLPRLTPQDVDEVLATDAQVVVAPTVDGGTGALLRTPPHVMGTAYGPRSGFRHLRMAEQTGVTHATVRAQGFREDIDTIEDLGQLREGPVGPTTAHVLKGLLDAADPPA